MTSDNPSSRDVFIQAVRDHLDGTPNANHPVQFNPKNQGETFTKCSLCLAVVLEPDQDAHRRYHDLHNTVHDQIMAQANRYVSPPTFGGR